MEKKPLLRYLQAEKQKAFNSSGHIYMPDRPLIFLRPIEELAHSQMHALRDAPVGITTQLLPGPRQDLALH